MMLAINKVGKKSNEKGKSITKEVLLKLFHNKDFFKGVGKFRS